MKGPKSVEHKGTVESVENGIVKVNILSQSACASCHAKGACSVADMEDKIIDVQTPNKDYNLGERVNVVMDQTLGFKALLYGYVVPFVIVMIVLFSAVGIGFSEGKAGLLSLAVLPPYYLGLYLLKDKMKQTFSFRIQKLD